MKNEWSTSLTSEAHYGRAPGLDTMLCLENSSRRRADVELPLLPVVSFFQASALCHRICFALCLETGSFCNPKNTVPENAEC